MGVQAVIGRVFPAWTDTAAMARFTAGWFTVLLFGAPGVLCGLLSKETAAEVGFRRPPGKALAGIVVAALALQPVLQKGYPVCGAGCFPPYCPKKPLPGFWRSRVPAKPPLRVS